MITRHQTLNMQEVTHTSMFSIQTWQYDTWDTVQILHNIFKFSFIQTNFPQYTVLLKDPMYLNDIKKCLLGGTINSFFTVPPHSELLLRRYYMTMCNLNLVKKNDWFCVESPTQE